MGICPFYAEVGEYAIRFESEGRYDACFEKSELDKARDGFEKRSEKDVWLQLRLSDRFFTETDIFPGGGYRVAKSVYNTAIATDA